MNIDLSAADWESRYLARDTPWDLSGPTPELLRLLREERLPKKGRALVPGGGRGHDAVALAQAGLETDLVDFAPSALDAALESAFQAKTTIQTYRRDFFELSTLPFHRGQYDLFWEYTFFCAIDPKLRAAYVRAAADLLRPGGLLAGLFFPLATDKEGPPFLVKRAELEELFRDAFLVTFEEPKNSVKPRAGRELLALFRKR